MLVRVEVVASRWTRLMDRRQRPSARISVATTAFKCINSMWTIRVVSRLQTNAPQFLMVVPLTTRSRPKRTGTGAASNWLRSTASATQISCITSTTSSWIRASRHIGSSRRWNAAATRRFCRAKSVLPWLAGNLPRKPQSRRTSRQGGIRRGALQTWEPQPQRALSSTTAARKVFQCSRRTYYERRSSLNNRTKLSEQTAVVSRAPDMHAYIAKI